VELYIHSPNTPSWHGAHLKHRDVFTSSFFNGKVAANHKMTALNTVHCTAETNGCVINVSLIFHEVTESLLFTLRAGKN
jgi:hypothetical protein